MIKTLTANQNPSCSKELEHLKWQSTKLQCILIINRTLSCISTNIVILIVICIVSILDVDRPLHQHLTAGCFGSGWSQGASDNTTGWCSPNGSKPHPTADFIGQLKYVVTRQQKFKITDGSDCGNSDSIYQNVQLANVMV